MKAASIVNEAYFVEKWKRLRKQLKPIAIIKFMLWQGYQIPTPIRANSYTAEIRNAISLGGDADTMACMAGGIAIATKGMEMPEDLAYYIYNHVLDDYLRHVLYEFNQLSPL